MILKNNYLHPYQNVRIELSLDDGASVKSVKPFKWSEKDNAIEVGFLEAELENYPYEVKV